MAIYYYILKGLIVGLAASIPLGPIGILCIQRTINKGRLSGFLTGLGAALGDTLYATVAIMSISYIKFILEDYSTIVNFTGGLIVILIGVKIFNTNPVKNIPHTKENHIRNEYLSDFISSFLMTVTNPGALILILGLFSYVGIDTTEQSTLFKTASTIAAVSAGATLWWFILSSVINIFRDKFRIRQLLVINKISGIIIIILGSATMASGIYELIPEYLIH